MSMEKQNVVLKDRTPEPELNDKDADWDKKAAEEFKQVEDEDKKIS